MTGNRHDSSRPSLAAAIYGFVALGAVLAAAGAWYLVSERLADYRQSALAEAVTARARGVEMDFARTLHQEWRNARTIAEDIADRDRSAVRSSLDLIVGDNGRVSWAGIATLDGTVAVASGGLLEGRDVSQRPWFQRGLEGDFAGDVHEAVLLAELLPTAEGGARRFLDLATPVRDDGGEVTGVLGLHMDYAWAQRYLRETADALALDVFIVNPEGEIVMASDELPETSLDLASIRAAAAGAAVTRLETWPDGVDYLTSVVPSIGYENLPSFGWSLVARIGNDAMLERSFSSTLMAYLAAFGVLLAVMTVVFVEIFARPFKRLAESARAVMRGEDVYPYETGVTSEAGTLSAAVARLQGRNR